MKLNNKTDENISNTHTLYSRVELQVGGKQAGWLFLRYLEVWMVRLRIQLSTFQSERTWAGFSGEPKGRTRAKRPEPWSGSFKMLGKWAAETGGGEKATAPFRCRLAEHRLYALSKLHEIKVNPINGCPLQGQVRTCKGVCVCLPLGISVPTAACVRPAPCAATCFASRAAAVCGPAGRCRNHAHKHTERKFKNMKDNKPTSAAAAVYLTLALRAKVWKCLSICLFFFLNRNRAETERERRCCPYETFHLFLSPPPCGGIKRGEVAAEEFRMWLGWIDTSAWIWRAARKIWQRADMERLQAAERTTRAALPSPLELRNTKISQSKAGNGNFFKLL